MQVKHTEILTEDDEMKLWKSGVIGVATPRALQPAAFLTVGKVFSLRGGMEHRSLNVSQLKWSTSLDQYTYYENVSNTCNGSLKNLHVRSKVVPSCICVSRSR